MGSTASTPWSPRSRWPDALHIEPRDDGRISLDCIGPDVGPVEENLAYRAAVRLAAQAPAGCGAALTLTKRIPAGGGLGGASSDAAATLAALNESWQLHLAPEQLAEIAAELGSDVPLFLAGSACRMTGRGDLVQPIDLHSFAAVLATPPIHCPTPDVYRAFDAQPAPMGEPLPPDLWLQPPSTWRDRLANQLAEPALRVRPALRTLRDRLIDAAGLPVHVTGSGSAMFILFDSESDARSALDTLPEDLRTLCQTVHSL